MAISLDYTYRCIDVFLNKIECVHEYISSQIIKRLILLAAIHHQQNVSLNFNSLWMYRH